MIASPTCIGYVRQVLGSTITVRLDDDLAGASPLWRGRLQPIGQVGSLVVIPQGAVRLVASVTLIGIGEVADAGEQDGSIQKGDRWLRAQLLGEIDALGRFARGVTSCPGLEDEVHFAEPELLRNIYDQSPEDSVVVGRLSSSSDTMISLDAAKIVTRHSVVVGSTGSGKTSTVASILQKFARDWDGANVIVIDPHGEYVAALDASASVRAVTAATPSRRLRVPHWALPAADILSALTGYIGAPATLVNRFAELVADERKKYARACSWLASDGDVNADTPIPFNLRQVWYQLDYENRVTVTKKQGGEDCVEDKGDAASLRPAVFTPYNAGSAAPMQGTFYNRFLSFPSYIRARMLDPRFAFFLQPDFDILDHDPFVEIVDEWLGGEKPVSVLDFSGVPSEAADLAIGVVAQLLFELSLRSTESEGVGRNRPVFFVMEEAHRYLAGESSVRLAQHSIHRIAREGRKYGIGMMLVTQRPSELPDTAFSQAGTVIALRLTNGADQSRVRSGLPDSLLGLSDALPSLRTGEALVAGEAVAIPSRVLIDRPRPAPRADDASLAAWRSPAARNDIAGALARWRGLEVEAASNA
jgi:DNA helicase HerA-like ATPase